MVHTLLHIIINYITWQVLILWKVINQVTWFRAQVFKNKQAAYSHLD